MATVIKVRRANLKIEIDKYTPKVGEFVFDKENKKLLYGDNFAIGAPCYFWRFISIRK